MGSEEILEQFYDGPCHALVIGISEYEHCQPPNEQLEDENFPRLKYAAKDADDFATFLVSNGVIDYNVKALLNSDASRENIYTELAELAERCAAGSQNPLVVVFFSGHGWPAPGGSRNYLIPYDARKDKLPGTAIRNDEFSRMLADVPTDRMVVFIDACHSGDIGFEGGKGLDVTYSHEGLGEGAGRYFIASCSPKEQSYEDDENGIFTKNLLLLLNGETDDITTEDINTSNILDPLSERVRKRAFEKYKRNQTITHSVKEGQGITLAVNRRVRAARVKKQSESKKEELEFFEIVKAGIKRSDSNAKRMLGARLHRYFETRKKDTGFDDLYYLYEESFNLWLNKQLKIEECIGYLLETHESLLNAPPPPPPDEKAQEPAKGGDRFVSSAEQNVLTADKLPRVTPPQPAGTEEQRHISTEDQNNILSDIMKWAAYYQDAKPLIDVLSKAVSEAVFVKHIHEARLRKKDDQDFSKILDDIVERFQECWARSPVVASAAVVDLRFVKGKSE
jgi:uncharacterized caspase-like protein